jgi:D-tagatose-1,6-bisphosphate aldolase subunit GatZ/KbaZ
VNGSLEWLWQLRDTQMRRGVTSVCSAHPIVLRAALRHGRETGATVLIEATCNQVNHLGGYTGMKPADFASCVRQIAEEERCPTGQIILGGDHLGPSPWRDLDAEQALAQAERMMEAYIAAGFRKIHLDASMGCKGESDALDDATTAERAARLAAVAEEAARRMGGEMPGYVIGTEVPPPGGADHMLTTVTPTAAAAARYTIEVHRETFRAAGLEAAFGRVFGLVVQPGVEFGNHNVVRYDPAATRTLVGVMHSEPQFVFEAHSTDYQGPASLSALVADGFAILKVGPELTFVLREALYGLDLIASEMLPDYGERPLVQTMERLMLDDPASWSRHYSIGAADARMLRHYSLSDRIRYYWAQPEALDAVERLRTALDGRTVPAPLFSQHLKGGEIFADGPVRVDDILIWRVTQSLSAYHEACRNPRKELA